MAKKKVDAAHALLEALRHPLRRKLLRLCVEAKEELSPKELALLADRPVLSNVAYHVRTLAKNGALELVRTAPVRGAVEHFYRPTKLVRETPWVLAAIDRSPDSQKASTPPSTEKRK